MFSATIAFSLSCVGSFGCSFVKFVSPTSDENQKSASHKQSGLWSYQWWDSSSQQYTCHSYPQTIEIDAKWKAARILSVMAVILGGLYLLSASLFWTASCCYKKLLSGRRHYQYLFQFWGTLCLLACVCETFSLIFLRSNACEENVIFNLMRNHNCQLSTGAKCTYAAMIFWLFAGYSACLHVNDKNDTAEESIREEDANLEQSLLQEFV